MPCEEHLGIEVVTAKENIFAFSYTPRTRQKDVKHDIEVQENTHQRSI